MLATLAPMARSKTTAKSDIVPIERIAASIYLIRGRKVMLDADLAVLYGVETKVFNQAVGETMTVSQGIFMFQLTGEETENLRSQIVTSSWGGRRYNPNAFTEQGVAMLSSVLKNKRAIEINIGIMRTFVRIRQVLTTNEELARKVGQHDRQIAILFEHVQKMLTPAPVKKNPIGFVPGKD